MTAYSYAGWKRKKLQRAELSFPIQPKRSRKKAKLSLQVLEKWKKGHRVPLDIKVGDRILFGKYTGSEIKLDGQEYLIVREEEILAKVAEIAKAAGGKK